MKTALAASVLTMAATSANAGVVDFDDLSGSTAAIYDGYMGFNWGNGVGDIYAGYISSGSYPNATVSESNVAFAGWDQRQYQIDLATSGSYTFNSGYFTSAWADTQDITFTGFLNGTEVYSAMTFSLNNIAPTLIELDWTGIDSLSITNENLVGSSEGHWAMDNFTFNESVSAVPEPSTVAMMLGGLGLVGLMAARRKKQA